MTSNVLPKAGSILDASLVTFQNWPMTPFVQDHDTGEFWSICAGYQESIVPVQRHTSDGWVAAVFHVGCGYIKIVGPGEFLILPRGQSVVARVHRQGVRWEFADLPA